MPVALLILGSLAGCSDIQFANNPEIRRLEDPREDIVLTDIAVTMTSGGLVQQRITGSGAVFAKMASDFTIDKIDVETFDSRQELQSRTTADMGKIYFAAHPQEDAGRKDMRFAGNVFYHTPQKDDPTTDSLQLRSDLIVWNNSREMFSSPGFYEMRLFPVGKNPVRQTGKGFEATSDLSRFIVRMGTITTEMDKDPNAEREQMQEALEIWRAEAEKYGAEKPDLPAHLNLEQ